MKLYLATTEQNFRSIQQKGLTAGSLTPELFDFSFMSADQVVVEFEIPAAEINQKFAEKEVKKVFGYSYEYRLKEGYTVYPNRIVKLVSEDEILPYKNFLYSNLDAFYSRHESL